MAERSPFSLLGVPINIAPFAEVVARVLDAPETGERLSMHFATVHSLVEAHDQLELRMAFARGVVEPDGMPLVWLGKRSGFDMERVCGPDFLPALIAGGIDRGRRHYFYGGGPGVSDALAARLTARFPGLQVAGTMSPPFRDLSPAEDRRIVDEINAAGPDYVWVGLGAPKQDLWVASHRPMLDAPALLAVGAAFDFHAGTRRRAPRWMQGLGMEWLYRLAAEPKRLASRYTRVNARFIWLVVKNRDATRRARRGASR
ncbi:MAG TPA: WecB/TagA/CpsF family glycosyltransferase [Candidatus Limnocylindria bacterium]|nr:WecB/TagA/CpsF family glycosyltransferase [Candidatus Limnocylindria bacterium]